MNHLLKISQILLLMVFAAPVLALPPLVDAGWVQAHKDDPQVAFLDIQDPQQYQRFHIPGAVNLPYSRWRTDAKSGGIPDSLPPVRRLEEMLGSAGIGNDDTVVIVATGRGAGDLAAAARVYWTFKFLGQDGVAILDGGLVAYARSGGGKNPLESGTKQRAPKAFEAKPNESLLASAHTVKAALDAGDELIDARSVGEYLGIYGGGGGARPGTIPGARNMPYDWLTVNGSAKLRDVASLRRLYKALGVDEQGAQIHFCSSGNRAALTWFVSHELLGNREATLYDASMQEWARRKDLPIEQKIRF